MAACLEDHFPNTAGIGLVPISDDNDSPLLGKFDRDSRSDARAAAGHNRNFITQGCHLLKHAPMILQNQHVVSVQVPH